MSPVHRREMLEHAIADIQGSIHANDSKSSAGLVVQGLLATAVVTLLTHLAGVYGEATATSRWVIKFALAVTLVLAGLSIFCLILAVFPHRAKGRFGRRNFHGHESVYFPDVKRLRKGHPQSELGRLTELFAELNGEDDVEQEYLSELLKVAKIRRKEAGWAKLGFGLLAAEMIFALLFLGTVGAVAGGLFGAARNSAPPTIRWEIVQGPRRRFFRAEGGAVLSGSKAQVRVRTSGPSEDRYLKLTRHVTYHCPLPAKPSRKLRGRPASHNARLFGGRRGGLVETFSLAQLRCPSGKTPSNAVWRFRAEVLSKRGSLRSGSLRVSVDRRG